MSRRKYIRCDVNSMETIFNSRYINNILITLKKKRESEGDLLGNITPCYPALRGFPFFLNSQVTYFGVLFTLNLDN